MKTITLTIILTACLFAPASLAAAQGNTYKTYANARFNYSISYPLNLLVPQGEAENGDGQIFRSRDGIAEMRVYGRHNVNNETLAGLFDQVSSEWGKGVTYKVIKGNWFVVTALIDGKIHYQKTMLRGGVFKTFEIEYDAARRVTYDPVTARIAKSFVG